MSHQHGDRFEMPRRHFLEGAALLAMSGAWTAAEPQARAQASPGPKPDDAGPLVGVHIASHSFYDEGVDHCLDFLQETARVNTLLVTSNSYYGAMFRPKAAQGYHGVPIRDGKGRNVTKTFFKPNPTYYQKTSLRHRPANPDQEYAGREVFRDLSEAANRRGMQFYERMYEPGGVGMTHNILGSEKVRTVDVFGERGERACWNHPDYLAWVEASVSDLFSTYPLDGIQYGAERNGPLSRLVDWARETPTCFCEHCRSRAQREGVDFDRARDGLTEMTRFIRQLERGGEAPSDGALVAFLRILMHYPEIFAWENMHYRAGEELHQLVYDTVKSIRPEARVGRHIDHAQGSWDIFFRAAMPYAKMAPCSDFIKVSTYHDILGPRLAHRIEAGYCKTILRGVEPDDALAFFYAMAGHDADDEPSFADLAEEGLSPEYVHRETERAVKSVDGEADVYAGIAIDIPRGAGWGTEASPSDPKEIEQAVRRAFEAGASGIVVCREYEEMHEPSLRAVGRALSAQ